MAIGSTRIHKAEPDPKDVAETWGHTVLVPSLQKAAADTTACLLTTAGKLTHEAILFMVGVLTGLYGPVFWEKQKKNPHKGSVCYQAPNGQTLKVERAATGGFFGLFSEGEPDNLTAKASGQTISRFLQVFGVAYDYFNGDRDKVTDALTKALTVAKSPTPNGLLQAARGNVREGTESSLEWAQGLLKPKLGVLEKAAKIRETLVGILNSVGMSQAPPEYLAVTPSDLEIVSRSLIEAMKRLNDEEPIHEKLQKIAQQKIETLDDEESEEEKEILLAPEVGITS